MSRIPSVAGALTSESAAGPRNSLNDLDLDVFLKLMIAELQNQDPLNPMENDQFLSQISQIREIGATDRLTKTLDSVLLGQSIASATNLIGADITAISDDNEPVDGIVDRVSIENGEPKLHIELSTGAKPSSAEGNIEAGRYSYRVVWEDDTGNLFGMEFSGAKAVTTTGTSHLDQSILLNNLPVTANPKQVYRTDATGAGPYKLVGTLNSGKQGTFVDRLSDEERSETQQTRPFQRSTHSLRQYQVSLNRVSAIRPPAEPAIPDPSNESTAGGTSTVGNTITTATESGSSAAIPTTRPRTDLRPDFL